MLLETVCLLYCRCLFAKIVLAAFRQGIALTGIDLYRSNTVSIPDHKGTVDHLFANIISFISNTSLN